MGSSAPCTALDFHMYSLKRISAGATKATSPLHVPSVWSISHPHQAGKIPGQTGCKYMFRPLKKRVQNSSIVFMWLSVEISLECIDQMAYIIKANCTVDFFKMKAAGLLTEQLMWLELLYSIEQPQSRH